MSLLALDPLPGFSPAPPGPGDSLEFLGHVDFPKIRQTTDVTCWAAASAALRQAFGFSTLLSERDFAESFWKDSVCSDAQGKTSPGWEHAVTDLDCVLQFAQVLVGELPDLKLHELLGSLRRGNVVASLMSDGGIRHVVVIWCAFRKDVQEPWFINVFDPNGGVNRLDLNPDPYLRPLSIETGR